MNRTISEQRTKQFHIDIIKLCLSLPKNVVGFETAKQLIRSAGSVAANYPASKNLLLRVSPITPPLLHF